MSRITKALAAAVPALATLATIGLGAGPAGAGAQYEPLIGDITGDGIADRVTLGGEVPGGCRATVERGKRNGRFHRPVTRTYATETPTGCPDMGVVVDLGGDGETEMVLMWWDHSNIPGVEMLVLRSDFSRYGTFRGVFQPQYIGTAHVDTDGLLDVYAYSDQGAGFRSYLNTPDGQLVPGPLRSCEENGRQDYQLADFDENGAQDIVFTYYDLCTPEGFGVAVVLDDGTIVPVHAGTDQEDHFDIEVVDVDGDGNLDVRTTGVPSGAVATYLGHGDGTFTAAA